MAGLGQNVGTSFSLTARMNGALTVGGRSYTAWYFTDGTPMSGRGFMGDRDLPSAHFECPEGQLVTVNFSNRSMMEHTIHLHGLDVDQANDGVPATSFAVPAMGSAVYRFTAPHAGTYHYHCHVDTVIHYARGMHGAVIVRPPGGQTNIAWSGGPAFDEELLWQLSTVDTSWMNLSVSGPGTARFRPDGFLLNGLESAAASADPYSMVVLRQGQTAYVRLVNAAYQWARVRLGGLSFRVAASDGRPMAAMPTVTEWELGPGERYDLLLVGGQPGLRSATVEYLDDHSGGVLGAVSTRIQVI
ncbi:MAG: multicopper oxidase domain-containing protein [Planctomycetes bacterium]|nr:multicopper oxidase domain-containing protein [Planctomycetota bacterium]